jgi:hypothetical protein
MSTVKWAAHEAVTSALTTELNSLANATLSSASAAIANHTDLYRYIDIFVDLASLTPTGSPAVNILFLYSNDDGTTFADASLSNSAAFVATLGMSTSASAKHLVAANIPIPPLDFKIALDNETGVALAASGSTVKYARHNESIA